MRLLHTGRVDRDGQFCFAPSCDGAKLNVKRFPQVSNSSNGDDDRQQRNLDLYMIEVYGTSIPRYAILSHTWSEDEVTLADIQDGSARGKRGFQKLQSARRVAAEKPYETYDWIWIDTCCIDQTSSTELFEAINSMYSWYADADRCFAHLEDVSFEHAIDGDAEIISAFQNARWFTRGWTLQELIAPRFIDFYSQNWSFFGPKDFLAGPIHERTGIPLDVLTSRRSIFRYSLAQRMSWSAGRTTTRPEDLAYSLMGLFSVNMPLLYGEGSRAFQRLQEEIVKYSDDQSIFAWTDPLCINKFGHGLFADHPSAFEESRDIVRAQGQQDSSPFTMTNKGLAISLPMREHPERWCLHGSSAQEDIPDQPIGWLAYLNCTTTTDSEQRNRLTVLLVADERRPGTYVRIRCHAPLLFTEVPWLCKLCHVFVAQSRIKDFNGYKFRELIFHGFTSIGADLRLRDAQRHVRHSEDHNPVPLFQEWPMTRKQVPRPLHIRWNGKFKGVALYFECGGILPSLGICIACVGGIIRCHATEMELGPAWNDVTLPSLYKPADRELQTQHYTTTVEIRPRLMDTDRELNALTSGVRCLDVHITIAAKSSTKPTHAKRHFCVDFGAHETETKEAEAML